MAKRSKKSKGYSIPQGDDEASVMAREGAPPNVGPGTMESIVAEAEEAQNMEVANFQGDEVKDAAPMEELREVDVAELAAEADVEADNAKPNSVVHPRFKDKYLANARLLGIPGKAAKRSNWDWLAQQIAAQCLDGKHKISITCFLQLLDANGVDHSRWTNRNKGWEGRLRMTGRVALQKVVANNGFLYCNGGTIAEAPADFIAKFRDKE